MAGNDRLFVPDRIDDSDEARVDPFAVVGDVGLVGASVTGEVGCHGMEAHRAERRDLMPPRVRELRKAVEHQHERTV